MCWRWFFELPWKTSWRNTFKNRVVCGMELFTWSIATKKLCTACWNCFSWISSWNFILLLYFLYAEQLLWKLQSSQLWFLIQKLPWSFYFIIRIPYSQWIFKYFIKNLFILASLNTIKYLWISNSSCHHACVLYMISLYFVIRTCKFTLCHFLFIKLQTFLFLMCSIFRFFN